MILLHLKNSKTILSNATHVNKHYSGIVNRIERNITLKLNLNDSCWLTSLA